MARGISDDKIVYIPNGADPEDFKPSQARDELRTRYGFTRIKAIYAGAHGPANGLDLLLEAELDVQDLPLDIVLVGGGVAKPALVNKARELGLTNVRFMDTVVKTDIPDSLIAADIDIHIHQDLAILRNAVVTY